MILKRFVCLLLLFTYSTLYSVNIDSLQKAIDKMPNDSIKVHLINSNLKIIYFNSPSLAKNYCLYSVKLSSKIGYIKGQAQSFGILAYIYLIEEKRDSNLYYIKKAIQLVENTAHTELLTKLYNNAGEAYFEMNNYEKALEYFTKCTNHYLKTNDSTGYYIAKANIISIFSTKKQYVEEEKLLRESLIYFTRNKLFSVECYTRRILSENLYHQKKYDLAEKEIRKSISIANQIKDTALLHSQYYNLSYILFALNKYDEAIEITLKDIHYKKEEGKYCSVCEDYLLIAKNTVSRKQYKDALPHLDSALYYQENFCKNELKTEAAIYENYSIVYEAFKLYDKAFHYHTLFKKISDSLNSAANNENVNELQTKYFTAEKENQIQLLEKDKTLKDAIINNEKKSKLYITSSFVLILLIIILLVTRFRNKQKSEANNQKIIAEKNKIEMEKELIEMEQKLLLTQMNPHFIFNSLNSIRAFISQNEGFKATEYLGDFAKLMRLILESSRKKLIPLEDEIKILEYYLKLEQVRSSNKFNYTISIDDEIKEDIESYKIPPMLIQPFVENSIHHGIMNSTEQGLISISFKQLNETTLEINIIDNGIGRKNAAELKEKFNVIHESYALKITEERIKHLENKYSTPITYTIVDMDKGTKVIFIIPIFTA